MPADAGPLEDAAMPRSRLVARLAAVALLVALALPAAAPAISLEESGTPRAGSSSSFVHSVSDWVSAWIAVSWSGLRFVFGADHGTIVPRP